MHRAFFACEARHLSHHTRPSRYLSHSSGLTEQQISNSNRHTVGDVRHRRKQREACPFAPGGAHHSIPALKRRDSNLGRMNII